ncbi:hypothetical protein COCCADRAFT_3678 [Bipolaris zeicola 26-R-13]|uniref:Uncharacterized protein n=1 Tax=Cochliobolus carbonum (strain 26-R-13) TaxID=930089 RepID=W6YAR1_COCC2|nr:uncharacterized protein COCCADRAFT_3678 [Bipolaris zeicola 26-R-13]EUC35048.1 hypothetical protein COCCADRAFT_3678 [Bipolaris zeicola 26-R-13]
MDVCLPVLLPFGLNEKYQTLFAEKYGVRKQHEPLHFHVLSLREISALQRLRARKLHFKAPSIADSAPNKHDRILKPKKIKKDRKSREEKRNHSVTIPKPPVSFSLAPKNPLRSMRNTNRNLKTGADQRLGASREIPIILDGDSAKSVTPGKLNPRIRDASASPELILRDMSPTHDLHSPVRPTNMRDARKSGFFLRIKSNTASPRQYHLLQSQKKPQTSHPKTPMMVGIPFIESPGDRSGATNSEEKDMKLVDIEDSEMRKKVTQLMAVAPALPVRDLYHLIIDSEGRLSKAKKKAIRMSEAPDTLCRPTQLSLRPRTPINNLDTEGVVVNINNSNTQTMVKIDPSDPIFKWDEDEPAPEPAPMAKPRRSKSTAKNKQTQSAHSHHSAKESKRKIPAAPTPTPSYQSEKRTKVSHSKRTSLRETSSDREFIVADGVMHYVSDFDDSDNFILSRNVIIPSRTRRQRRKFSMI